MPKTIKIPEQEIWDSEKNEFSTLKSTTFKVEHSLVAIAKWESKWHVAFLDDKVEKTNEMMIDYIRCMTITQNVDPMVYEFLTQEAIQEINDYIKDPMTATVFTDRGQGRGGNGEFVTNEVVYYWMIAQNIPLECEKWHFNRLMTLIRVCSEKNSPSKKMNKRDILNRNKALNAARRAKHGTRG